MEVCAEKWEYGVRLSKVPEELGRRKKGTTSEQAPYHCCWKMWDNENVLCLDESERNMFR